MAEEIQRLPEFLRPEEPSDLSDMRLLLPAGCAHKAVAARAEEGVPQGPGALVAEAPDPTGVEHQAKMLDRVRKFVATSLNGTKDGKSGDRAAVKMLMETTEGDSLLTFSTVHPKTGQQHTAKGGYYTCDLCNKTNKYDDGAACIAHVCGPAHIEKWLQANENTLETKDSLQARMPPKWGSQRSAASQLGQKRKRSVDAAQVAAAAAAGAKAGIVAHNAGRSPPAAPPPLTAGLATPQSCRNLCNGAEAEAAAITPATAAAAGRAIAATAMGAA